MPPPPRQRLYHEHRVQLIALAGALPAVATSLIILWTGDYSEKVRWTLTILIATALLIALSSISHRVSNPLRTLANLLEAMREGDYSIRARGARNEDALGEVMQQVNAMGATLRAQRLGALEATTLLRKVMEEIDVAVFAFDAGERLRLVNRAGERLLAQPAERLLTRSAAEIGLNEVLATGRGIMQRTFPGGSGRWGINCSDFREGGLPHQLLVLADITRPLREEELQAWQRLVRVLGHELNNSLTPIKSIAGSLHTLLGRPEAPPDWREDALRGLEIIASRSESLARFMAAYAQLARLPRPKLVTVQAESLIRRAAALETRLAIDIRGGPAVMLEADPDQLEQALINLLRNAVDAALETDGAVDLAWSRTGGHFELRILDRGPGLANTANLFVPFFTTKPGGSGIGLVLARQIAEAHGGTLELVNRTDGPGCLARLTLPL